MRPTKRKTALGDVHRVWKIGGFAEVVESTACGGVPMPRHYFVGLVRCPKVIKRFKKLRPAIAFAAKLAEK